MAIRFLKVIIVCAAVFPLMAGEPSFAGEASGEKGWYSALKNKGWYAFEGQGISSGSTDTTSTTTGSTQATTPAAGMSLFSDQATTPAAGTTQGSQQTNPYATQQPQQNPFGLPSR
ncbi:MAG: hypothetical protein WCG78_06510 [Candidatus Omnitrophota bacterium]